MPSKREEKKNTICKQIICPFLICLKLSYLKRKINNSFRKEQKDISSILIYLLYFLKQVFLFIFRFLYFYSKIIRLKIKYKI